MLELNFVLPDIEVSIAETKKRLDLLSWFVDYVGDSISGLVVSGSMGYGQNYSVKPSSDIDMQILVNKDVVENLLTKDHFNSVEINHAVSGYLKETYFQFSSPFVKDDVIMECHFWDEDAYINAGTYKQQFTPRLRANIDTPSKDFAFSFVGEVSEVDFYGEMVGEYAVSDFPSYRKVEDKLFLCRAVSNLIGAPKVIVENGQIQSAIDESWSRTVEELVSFAGTKDIDLEQFSVKKALLGNNKMSPESLDFVNNKTIELLKTI